ncbi:MAG TPA: DUF4180 domain-containing protein [Flexilinea sp.]|nr:DUF4180 domain-containing protein [Flexilinea sp.]
MLLLTYILKGETELDIRYAILGLLRNTRLSGYDLKKAMVRSPLLYWSGNNNQVYRTLAELEKEDFVVGEVEQKDTLPLKKVYSITENGKKELQRLSRDFPEMPEIRKPFSIQLLFGGDLSRTEAESLLDRYADEIEGTIAMASDENPLADPTPYEAVLSKLATDNIRRFYESELLWVEKVRSEALPLLPDESDACRKKEYDMKMETIKVQKKGKDYVKVISGKINDEKDGLALVSACIENDTNRLLLPSEALSDAFYDLSTQLTGLVLQKLVNYRIRAAAVIEPAKVRGKFKDFMIETNRGHMFRLFEDFEQAEDWLLKD